MLIHKTKIHFIIITIIIYFYYNVWILVFKGTV